jgi:hypothetical protein
LEAIVENGSQEMVKLREAAIAGHEQMNAIFSDFEDALLISKQPHVDRNKWKMLTMFAVKSADRITIIVLGKFSGVMHGKCRSNAFGSKRIVPMQTRLFTLL